MRCGPHPDPVRVTRSVATLKELTGCPAFSHVLRTSWLRPFSSDRVLCGEADEPFVAADGCGESEKGRVVAASRRTRGAIPIPLSVTAKRHTSPSRSAEM